MAIDPGSDHYPAFTDSFPQARVHLQPNGDVFVIRDVWSDGGNEYRKGLSLMRCEYAVHRGNEIEWKPCAEGVRFSDIEPYRNA